MAKSPSEYSTVIGVRCFTAGPRRKRLGWKTDSAQWIREYDPLPGWRLGTTSAEVPRGLERRLGTSSPISTPPMASLRLMVESTVDLRLCLSYSNLMVAVCSLIGLLLGLFVRSWRESMRIRVILNAPRSSWIAHVTRVPADVDKTRTRSCARGEPRVLTRLRHPPLDRNPLSAIWTYRTNSTEACLSLRQTLHIWRPK